MKHTTVIMRKVSRSCVVTTDPFFVLFVSAPLAEGSFLFDIVLLCKKL